MAEDMIHLMDYFSIDEFFVAGHDRGGRVAHRLARDYQNGYKGISVLDICPTLDMYEATNMKFAQSYFHWFFLIQPKGLPEKMIESDPKKMDRSLLEKWSGGHEFGEIENAYLTAFQNPQRIHASCEITELLHQLTWNMIAQTGTKCWIFLSKCCGGLKE